MGGFNVYGQLVRAQLEQWASDPTPGVTGRIGYNSVTNRFALDNGSAILSVITDKSTVSNYLDWTQVSDPAAPASSTNRIYFKADGNLYTKNSSNVVTQLSSGGVVAPNYLYNTDFALWQRGTSTTLTSAANSATPTYKYLADRWFCNNILGYVGMILFIQRGDMLFGSP